MYYYPDFRNESDEENVEYSQNYVPTCPYCEYMYRQFPSGRPPMGGPGGTPPFGPPGFGSQPFGPPQGPPPAGTPQQIQSQAGIQAVSPGSIRPCTFRYVYIWLDNGRSFWAWLTNVDRRTASGWRWNGRRWVYFGIDLRRIAGFTCY